MWMKHCVIAIVLVLLNGEGQLTAAGEWVTVHASDSGRFFVNPTENPNVVFTQDFTNGHSDLLGNYNLVGHELVDLATFEITEGAFTITTQKGDTIRGEYSGTAAATQAEGVITYLVTGPVTRGTGRFAGARGTLTISGVADLRTGVLSEVLTGQLSFGRGR